RRGPARQRPPDERPEGDQRADELEQDRRVLRRRGGRVLAPEEPGGGDRLARPALLPAHLLHEEAAHGGRHDRLAGRGRLVHDAPVAQETAPKTDSAAFTTRKAT